MVRLNMTCPVCHKWIDSKQEVKYYGDGTRRHYPKCVRKYERQLNTRRDALGRFGEAVRKGR